MKIRTPITAAALALVLGACATANPEPVTYYDTDEDDVVTRAEYVAASDNIGYFDDWDLNRDAYLDFNEYREGMRAYGYEVGEFTVWDEDDDNRLTRDELYGGSFDELDSNDNATLEAEELGSGVRGGYWVDTDV